VNTASTLGGCHTEAVKYYLFFFVRGDVDV